MIRSGASLLLLLLAASVGLLRPTAARAQLGTGDPKLPIVLELSGTSFGVTGDERWSEMNAAFTWTRRGSTILFFANRSWRPEGNGAFVAAGAYYDWSPKVFTYASATFGVDRVGYLPKTRFDLDVNTKWLSRGNLVITGGATQISYTGDRGDTILSAGAAYYAPVVISYRIFRNWSYPGRITSHSQMIQASRDVLGKTSTLVRLSWGVEAYLATYVAVPVAVSVEGWTVTASHKHWITNRFGVIAEIEYQEKLDTWHRFGGKAGGFISF